MTAFRESIAETLSTVSKAKARSATLWERVEKLRALAKKAIDFIVYWRGSFLELPFLLRLFKLGIQKVSRIFQNVVIFGVKIFQ